MLIMNKKNNGYLTYKCNASKDFTEYNGLLGSFCSTSRSHLESTSRSLSILLRSEVSALDDGSSSVSPDPSDVGLCVANSPLAGLVVPRPVAAGLVVPGPVAAGLVVPGPVALAAALFTPVCMARFPTYTNV